MKKLTLALFCLVSISAWSQQAIQFTQYMNNRLFYNPGVAGSNGSICLNGTHRSQWVGFDDAPVTQNFNVEVPIRLLHGGVFASITNDRIGFFQNVNSSLGYAYQHEIWGGVLGAGFSIDFNTMALANGQWITPDGGTGVNDGSIPAMGSSSLAIDGTLGLYFKRSDFWAGISTGKLIQTESDLTSLQGISKFKGSRALILMGGYNYFLPNTNWVLKPSAIIKDDIGSSTISFDFNVNATYNNKLTAGLGYRLQDAVSLMVGYNILPSLRLNYSYDIVTSELSAGTSGSHEIYIGYCFKIEIPPRPKGGYTNPIFL